MIQRTVFDLSPAEKLQLVEDLWDDLSADPSNVPVSGWQIAELDRRKAHLESHSVEMLSWDEVRTRLRGGHAD